MKEEIFDDIEDTPSKNTELQSLELDMKNVLSLEILKRIELD